MNRYDQFEHASLSDVGIKRSHNQDACTVLLVPDQEQWREKGHVFHVADGMGAHAVGELASQMACQIIPHTYHKYAHEGIVPAVQKAFTEANASIYDRGRQNREFEGMGTTSSCLILREDGAWIGHVGDSRVYRIRDGVLHQLSFDHSLVWEKARRQHVSPEELQNIPSNVIVRSLGPEPEVEADICGPHPVKKGDIFVICSDGLSGPLSDAELGAVASALPPNEACRFLVDLANLRGGPDNITVIVVKIGKKKKGKKGDEYDDDDEDYSSRPRKPSIFRRVPWPLYVLLLGLALAGGSVWMVVNKLPMAPLAFASAALTIIGGLVGLVVYHFQEKARRVKEPEYQPRTKVYREADVHIEKGVLEKLRRAEEVLIHRAKEKQWEIDWERQAKHHQLAETALAEGNFTTAFRETCRAMRPMTEALDTSRHKEESFKPNWDVPQNE